MSRRAVLLLVLLAALVGSGGYSWWTRPRIDPRLVGTWYLFRGQKMSLDEIDLHSNGYWVRRLIEKDQGLNIMMMAGAETWDVRDGVLTLHSRQPLFLRGGSLLVRWRYTSQQLWNRLAGNPPVHGVRRYQILNEENGRMALQEMELLPNEQPLPDFSERSLSSYVDTRDYGLERRFRWKDRQMW